MITFAEYLIARSGIPSGTATMMQHLNGISDGGTSNVSDACVSAIASAIIIVSNDVTITTELNALVNDSGIILHVVPNEVEIVAQRNVVISDTSVMATFVSNDVVIGIGANIDADISTIFIESNDVVVTADRTVIVEDTSVAIKIKSNEATVVTNVASEIGPNPTGILPEGSDESLVTNDPINHQATASCVILESVVLEPDNDEDVDPEGIDEFFEPDDVDDIVPGYDSDLDLDVPRTQLDIHYDESGLTAGDCPEATDKDKAD